MKRFLSFVGILGVLGIYGQVAQAEGGYEFVWKQPSISLCLSLPSGVAVDSSGNVYVADSRNNRIQKFDSSGTFITIYGSHGAEEGQFSYPRGVAVDSSGNLYVADSNNNRIQKFSPSGTFITIYGSYGNGDGQFNYPCGVAVDSSGNVYVADANNCRIQKFNSNGTFITKWGNRGTENGQFNFPSGVAVDSSGNVYVADTENCRIQKFNSNGTFITKWGSNGTGDGQFSYPRGVAVSSSGNLYVADTYNHRIQKFNSSGTFITKWGSGGTGDGQFNSPTGVAVDSSGNLYVTDTNNYRIQKFNSMGTFITKWGSPGDGQFTYPYGVAVDSSGNAYVADTENHRIQKFNPSGAFITIYGSYGNGDGQFAFPSGVAVDLSGNLYVADTENRRIQKFDSSEGFITKWGSTGSGDGQFSCPSGVAVDSSGNVYVADSWNNRIQKFDSDGAFITKWGSMGSGGGQFNHPRGVAVDSSGNVYVADTYNNRIQKFSSSGTFITKWGSTGSGGGQFSSPHGIAVDSSGNVYVADTNNHRIQKFSSSGTFITKWGSNGTGDSQFSYPYGVAISLSGNVYVADTNNHRIQKFRPNITSISHNATSPLKAGNTLTVTLVGVVNGTATFDIGAFITGRQMSQVSPGTYIGSYLVVTGNNVKDAIVRGHLLIGMITYSLEATPTVTLDTIEPTFTVTVSPDPVGLGTLTIIVTPDELLKATPTLTIKDIGNATMTTTISFLNGTYTYQAAITSANADGTATISVVGTDMAENQGIGSKTFQVSIPRKVVILDGEGQTGTVATTLKPYIVKVTDSLDRPIAGHLVYWQIIDSPATANLSTTTTTTGINGTTSSTLTLGTKSGTYRVTASGSMQATFTATGTPGTASILSEVSGNDQTGTVATALIPFVIKVTDTYGNPIAGHSVHWQIIDSPATASLSATTTTTGANGTTSSTLTLGTKSGTYRVTASGSMQATFTATATPGTPNILNLMAPSTVTANASFTLTITLSDSNGNLCSEISGIVTMTNTTSSIIPDAVNLASGSKTIQAVITRPLAGGADTITVTYTAMKTATTIKVFISNLGGTVTDKGATIEFDPGDLGTTNVTVHIATSTSISQPLPGGAIALAGIVYNIDLLDEQDNQVGTIAGQMGTVAVYLSYSDNPKPGDGVVDNTNIREENLVIYHLENGTWKALETKVNSTENYALAYVTHFSTFTLAGIPTTKFSLNNNNAYAYPNPYKEGDKNFSGGKVSFGGVSEGAVIKVYNIAGELIDEIKAGQSWDVRNIASGVYIYTVTGGGGGKSVGKIGIMK